MILLDMECRKYITCKVLLMQYSCSDGLSSAIDVLLC